MENKGTGKFIQLFREKLCRLFSLVGSPAIDFILYDKAVFKRDGREEKHFIVKA